MLMSYYKPFKRGIEHSAKGSTWENHKYIKRIDGTYYYPDNYEGGRHLPDIDKEEFNQEINISGDDVEKLAQEVIRGNFGNGIERKNLLGEYYDEVQKRVNELMKSSVGSKKIPSDMSDHISIVEEAAQKAISLVNAYRNKSK